MTSFFEKVFYYQKKNRVLSHVLFWIAVLLISVNISKYRDGRDFTYGFAMMGNGLYLIPQLIASYLLSYWLVPQFFFRKKHMLALSGFIAGSYLICVLARFLIVRVAEPLAGLKKNPFETNAEILTDLPKLFYVYFFSIFSLAFVFMFIKLLKDQLEVQKRALTLEKQKAEAELKLLKTQLNPHFLFNTLNNIYALSLGNAPQTSDAIARLSEILDYILYQCNSIYVPVSGEIVLLKNYISLEKLRYDERLAVDFQVDQQYDIEIAPLILLSIVENAFKHGAGNNIGSPVVNIELCAETAHFNFKVTNTFQSRPETGSVDRIGLPNLKQQLDLIYPGKHSLQIGQNESLFTVELHIDLS